MDGYIYVQIVLMTGLNLYQYTSGNVVWPGGERGGERGSGKHHLPHQTLHNTKHNKGILCV